MLSLNFQLKDQFTYRRHFECLDILYFKMEEVNITSFVLKIKENPIYFCLKLNHFKFSQFAKNCKSTYRNKQVQYEKYVAAYKYHEYYFFLNLVKFKIYYLRQIKVERLLFGKAAAEMSYFWRYRLNTFFVSKIVDRMIKMHAYAYPCFDQVAYASLEIK